jgi:hypothetical protein
MLKTEAQHACSRSRSRSNGSAAVIAEVWRRMALAGDVLCNSAIWLFLRSIMQEEKREEEEEE